MLFKLIGYAKHYITEHKADLAYGIVMDGTIVQPHHYTGRLGIPLFHSVASIYVLQIMPKHYEGTEISTLSNEDGYFLYLRISENTLPLSNVSKRSEIKPIWIHHNHQACALIEDTRKAKRLYLLNNQEEIKALHLSYFNYLAAKDGIHLLKQAVSLAFQYEYHCLFVAMHQKQFGELSAFINEFTYEISIATLYATDPLCTNIPINSSEI